MKRIVELLEGGDIIPANVTWVGDVTETLITSGTKDKPATVAKYYFMLKTSYHSYQSLRYDTPELATADREALLAAIDAAYSR